MDTETHSQIIEILDTVPDMTIATVRPDGFPQATVVAFVHDDLRLYFATGRSAQKARNIALCDKVSATVTKPYDGWDEIEGVSLGGHAGEVTDPDELRAARTLIMERFPQTADLLPEDIGEIAVFRIDPVVIALLDYSRGFGHVRTIEVEAKLPG
jgi:nitroimidazol reductase NimA-like FMN-containing flavoprotein (pyridoxamine 5'-phosphate oxidase superfamily)